MAHRPFACGVVVGLGVALAGAAGPATHPATRPVPLTWSDLDNRPVIGR